MSAKPKPQAVVAGHLCLDITPAFFEGGAPSAESLLRPGSLTRVGAADVHPGGCVANTGLALRRLGVPTRLVARVGGDAFAGLLRELVGGSGTDCALTADEGSSTSYSVVLAPPGIDRMFLHNAGANERFSQADVPDALLEGARLLHFGYPPLMPRMYRGGGEELAALFYRAKALGLLTSLDMAAFDPASEAATVDWPALLARVLPFVDFFLPSAEELCQMLDRPRYQGWLARAGGGDVAAALQMPQDVAPLAETLLALGCRVAVVKCGARGLYYQAAGEAALRGAGLPPPLWAWAGQRGCQPAFKPHRLLSATGAGDTSIAAFLASALEGLPLARCAARAAATGACCVQAYDALSGLKTLAELDQMIASGWETNP